MNVNIGDEVQCKWNIKDVKRKRKLTLFGHIYRMSDQCLKDGMIEEKQSESRMTKQKMV